MLELFVCLLLSLLDSRDYRARQAATQGLAILNQCGHLQKTLGRVQQNPPSLEVELRVRRILYEGAEKLAARHLGELPAPWFFAKRIWPADCGDADLEAACLSHGLYYAGENRDHDVFVNGLPGQQQDASRTYLAYLYARGRTVAEVEAVIARARVREANYRNATEKENSPW